MEIRDLLTFEASDELCIGTGTGAGAAAAATARAEGARDHDTPPLSARRSWGPPEPDDGPLPLEAAILAYLARRAPPGRPAAG